MRFLARFIPVIAAVWLGPASWGAAAPMDDAGAPLTLADAVRIGLRRNASLEATRAETDVSEAGLRVARAARWPRLFTEAGWHRTDNQVLAFGDKLTAAEFTPADFAIDSLNHPDAVSHGAAALAVEVPLFTAGRIKNGIEAAGEASLAARARQRAAEVDLVVRITEAYDGVSVAAAAVDAAERALANASAHERVAQARFENGAALKSDYLRAQVHRLAREQDLERKRGDLDLARAGLRLLLGFGADEPLVLAGAETSDPEQDLGEFEDWLGPAGGGRPDLEAARRIGLAAAAQGRAESAARGPEIAGTARYERNAAGLDAGDGSFFAGVGIRWTAFDRGRAARIEAARARAAAAQAWSRAADDRARLELEQAYRDARVAGRNLITARRAVSAAEEARRISAERYASGLLPLTDLLDAETAHLASRLAAIAAQHDALVGRVRLQRASGRLEVPR